MGRIVQSDFRPAWWLPGPHAQTLWGSLARRSPAADAAAEAPTLTRRRLELADGDFIDLSIADERGGEPGSVLIIHGLEGDLRSHYAGALVRRLHREGLRPAFMHLRGAGGEPNRLDRSYHSGATEDVRAVLETLAQEPGLTPRAVVGFSLGGNLLLKLLGEQPDAGRRFGIEQAIAVSVPFVLRDAMLRLELGFSRIYRGHLVSRLKRSFRRKFDGRPLPESLHPELDLDAIRDFNAFDDRITAPLNGFAGVFDYYQRASCRQFLPHIQTPTLIIQAVNDPFMFPATLPFEHELGPGVTLEISRHGGHVGFIAGGVPGRPVYWLEERILRALDALLPGGPSSDQHGT
jgi:predicted alpha/beta-fold hydrolase